MSEEREVAATTQRLSSTPLETIRLDTVYAESPWMRSLKRFRRHRLAMFGVVILTTLTVAAVFAPYFSRYRYDEINLYDRYEGPSVDHWLGADGTGRDVWARVLMGGRVSLSVGLVAVSISTVLGVILGAVAGYMGGWIDNLIMRLTDMVMSFPPLIIIIVLVSALKPSIYNSMIAIGLLGWPGLARLVRGNFLALREREFVIAAQCLGARPGRIIFIQILPNTVGAVLVATTLHMSTAVLMEAGLSFLGLGVQPPTPSWGNMLQSAQNFTLMEQYPWLWIPPGIAIMLTVLSINFIGDGLTDAFNPRQLMK